MNIIDLNAKLFDTIEKLEKGEMDVKHAQAIVNVSNAISNNAKLMLSAAKLSKNPSISNQLFGEKKLKEIEAQDLYERKADYAFSLGLKSIGHAYEKLGRENFERNFKEYSNNLNK